MSELKVNLLQLYDVRFIFSRIYSGAGLAHYSRIPQTQVRSCVHQVASILRLFPL